MCLEDRVELARVYLTWRTTALFEAGDVELDVLADLLAGGLSTRLHRALVRDRRLATDVGAWQDSREMAGLFAISATVAPTARAADVAAVVEDELARLAVEGPSGDELARVLRSAESATAALLQRVGGFGGRSDQLNRYNCTRDARHLAGDLAATGGWTERGARRGARLRQSAGSRSRSCRSVDRRRSPGRRAGGRLVTPADRTALPGLGEPSPFEFPRVATDALPNGIRLSTIDRPRSELVTVLLLLRHGSATDPPGREGLAALTGDLLDEGSRERSGIELHRALQRIGGALAAEVTSDGTLVSVTALARFAREAIAHLIEVVAHPRFDPDDVDRVRGLRLNRLAQMQRVAGAVADRAWLAALYGSHPYAHSPIGSASSLEAAGAEDVAAFHARHFGSPGWTVIVVGSGGPAAGLAAESARGWPGSGRLPSLRRPTRSPRPGGWCSSRAPVPCSRRSASGISALPAPRPTTPRCWCSTWCSEASSSAGSTRICGRRRATRTAPAPC